MNRMLKIERGSGNVFLDLGCGKAEAENLKLRSELMMRIGDCCKASGRTQAEVAKALGLTQPRLNALLKGRIDQFSLDALGAGESYESVQRDYEVTREQILTALRYAATWRRTSRRP